MAGSTNTPINPNGRPPPVTVIIPTHRRRGSVLRVLESLTNQSAPPDTFEVIVVCDGDYDGSVAACRAFEATAPFRLTVVEQANQGRAAARNAGVARARGELLIFLDDDIVADRNMIAAHVRAQSRQDDLVTIGPTPGPPDMQLHVWDRWEGKQLQDRYDAMASGQLKPTYEHFVGANASVLRQHVIKAGGFDPNFHRAEDMELGFRLQWLGLRFAFLPDAVGWHYNTYAFQSWVRLSRTYGDTSVEMARVLGPRRLDDLARWYRNYHPLARALAHACIGRPRIRGPFSTILNVLILAVDRVGGSPGDQVLCSLAYSVGLWDSVSDALGGRAHFLDFIRDSRSAYDLATPADSTCLQEREG